MKIRTLEIITIIAMIMIYVLVLYLNSLPNPVSEELKTCQEDLNRFEQIINNEKENK